MYKHFVKATATTMLFAGLVGSVSFAKAVDSTAGKSLGDQHRSEVSRFVQNLNSLAGQDENIGAEVRAVAREQAKTASKSAEALDGIEHRNPIVTFLFGTDYHRIGTLRSSLVTSQNEITRLTKALARETDPAIKAGLQKQIDDLKAMVAKITQFIQDNESKISVLGWVVRLFVK